MIQRHEPKTIEQELILARQQLAPDFQQLAQTPPDYLSSSDSANFILAMIARLSSPTIGINILRTDLFQIGFPFMEQFNLIIEKAESFYFQSIIQDLNRMSQNEALIQINSQNIKQCIEEINWKINAEREPILNSSQQVGENMDLMKFFEGIRNYQNWQDNIRKQCFERLKERSHEIQNQLTFKKGFILSKFQNLFNKIKKSNQVQIFSIANKNKRRHRIFNILNKFAITKQKDIFYVIRNTKKQPDTNSILLNLFGKYVIRRLRTQLKKIGLFARNKKQDLKILIDKMMILKRNREFFLKYSTFKLLNTKPMIKASSFTKALQITTIVFKKLALRIFVKAINLPTTRIFKLCDIANRRRLFQAFKMIKRNSYKMMKRRPVLSDRMKGKILVSLDKHEKVPMDAKKMFIRWYLNTHESQYAKKIYNIWLKGPTNKFTVFMRLKNMIKLVNKSMMSKQMKSFVKILCDRYAKYEQYNTKAIFIKWVERTRKIRKIESMFQLLSVIADGTQQAYKKISIQSLISKCKRKQIVRRYCNKYLLTFTSNRVIALEKWRKINNIKKQWGKKKLKVMLFNIINQIKAKQRQVLNIFQNYRKQGRQKKISICNKAFNKDLIFLQRFYQTWRNNTLKLKETAKQSYQSAKNNKTGSILQINSICSRVTTFNLRGIMNKFKQNRILREKRKMNIKNSFIRIIQDNQKINKKDIVQFFKFYWNLGKIKKEKLVSNFVHSNVIKEKVSFWIWKNKSLQMKELQKREKSTKIFEILQEKVKDNYKIFNKKLFVSNVLQKIIINRTKKIQYALDVWKAMPLRIRWNLRRKVIILHDKLMNLKNERLSKCHTVFKQSFIIAQMKKKKGVYIMACQFQNVVKKYFFMYKKNVEDSKQNKQIESVSKIFKTMNQIQKANFKPMILAPAVWPQKLKHLQKLNARVNKRLHQYFESWHKSAQALQYLEKITNQKKKRCLQILNQTMIDHEANRAKNIIQRFHHNNHIHQLQITFLKRLTESQGGRLVKGFMAWKNLPVPKNKLRIGKATKFESNLSRMVFRNLKKTFNIFKDNKYYGDDSKKYCINKLVAKTSNGVSRCFSKWRQNKRLILIFAKNRAVEKLFNTIIDKHQVNFQRFFAGKEAKLKRKSLNLIENFWNKQKKYYIKRWMKNVSYIKLNDVTKKHMLINLSNIQDKFSKRFIVDKICSKFNANRLMILKEKNRLRCERILHVVQTELSHRHTILNSINDRMKFNHYRGIFIKNKGCHKFLDCKIKAVHNVLALWNMLAVQARQSKKQKITTNSFDNLNESLKANYSLIFAISREQDIKKNTLDKLFNAQQRKQKAYFNLWRQRIQQLKILGELDRHTKAAILERITKILDATSTQKVRETIKKFYMNSKIEKVQRKFVERLMQTKGGKVIQAFKSWQSIPVSKMSGKNKNYTKFYFKLQSFYIERLKFVRKTFSETNEAGIELKKKSILKLFEMTSLGIRKFYNRWTRLTKQKHILSSVMSTMKAFQSSSKAVQNSYPIIFKDKKTYQMKIHVIENLVAAIKHKAQNYLLKWRDHFREDKARRKIEDDKKKVALKNLSSVFMSSNYGRISNIISLFQKNVKMVKISKTFFSRLMSTKTGKVIKFFQKLRTLPDAKLNKRKKKGIVFESRLHSFVHGRLRKALNSFKDSNFDAAAKKKFCLDKLRRACMGQNQKKFLIWRNVVREGKILHHTSLFQKIFEKMESKVQQNVSILIKDSSKQIQKKKALCRKLMNNSLFSQHHAYMIWKEAYRVDGINITKKENITQGHLKNLFNIFSSHQNKNIVQTVGAFRRILELRHFEEYNFYKDYKNQKCLNFFDNLKRIHESNRSTFINALKSNQSQFVLAQKSTKLLAVLHLLQNITEDNFSTMMRTEKKTAMVNKTFTRIFNNWKNNISRTFNIWRENKNKKKIISFNQNEHKKNHLLLLNSLLNQNFKFKITSSINQFYQNLKIRKIKNTFLIKILKTKSEKMQTAFNAWKMVPYQQARKSKNVASKFENNLARFLINRIKQVTNCFKKSNLDGIIKKQNAVRNIVRSKLIESKGLFFKWRKINNENKITEKIVSLDKVLATANYVYQDNFSIFEDCKIQDHRKIQLVTSLFNKSVTKLRDYFIVWRQFARSQKLHLFERYMRNFNPEDFNKRLMRIGFMMIQKRKDMESMKGYINSLWKWKMSNIQATYYTKFIKVFKESQEMIKLSNLLNKKIYENQHHSFRSILSIGMDRNTRKREIVQKYLLRKARNYFMTFKNSTLQSEINVWKSKYTETIKAKIWTDILSTVLLKTEFMGFNLIRNYSEYTKKIQYFEVRLTKYQTNNLRESFQKIKCEGYLKFISKINLLYQTVERDYIEQGFNLIKIVGKIQMLRKLIQSTMRKNVLQFGFNQIRKRKEKIAKSRLSLILLETIISQDKINKIKEAVVEFKKNRMKTIAPEKLFKLLKKKYDQYGKDLISGGVNVLNITKIIQRFKRAQTLKRILEKQDEQLKKAYLNKMRKKQNKWMELAIQKFATRASIRSSPAICLWRLKTYALNA